MKYRNLFVAAYLALWGIFASSAAQAASITAGFRIEQNKEGDRDWMKDHLSAILTAVASRCLDPVPLEIDSPEEVSLVWEWEGTEFDSNVLFTIEAVASDFHPGLDFFLETDGSGTAADLMTFQEVNFEIPAADAPSARGLVAGNNTLVVVLGDEQNEPFHYVRTSNGIDWEVYTHESLPTLKKLFFLNDRFFAIAEDAGGGKRFLYSQDAVTWNSIDSGVLPGMYIDSSYGEGVYFIQAFSSTIPPVHAIYSLDGLSWSEASVFPVQSGVAFSDGLFVATGTKVVNSGQIVQRVFVSEDGLTWNELTGDSYHIPGIVDFNRVRGKIIAHNGEFFTSFTDWKKGDIFHAGDLFFVSDGKGLYYSSSAYDIFQKADLGGAGAVSDVQYAFGSYWAIVDGALVAANYTGTGASGHPGCQRTTWAGFPVVGDRFVDTLGWIGWVYLSEEDWTFNYDLNSWIYMPEEAVSESGSWGYILR